MRLGDAWPLAQSIVAAMQSLPSASNVVAAGSLRRMEPTAGDIDIREDYMGPRYGAVTASGREALDLLARTEGILLDPVYTAKAMAGLIHDARQGCLGREDTVVFLHTGGLPAVFAYRDEQTIRECGAEGFPSWAEVKRAAAQAPFKDAAAHLARVLRQERDVVDRARALGPLRMLLQQELVADLVRVLRGEVHADPVAGSEPVAGKAEVGALGELEAEDVLVKFPGALEVFGDEQEVVQFGDGHGGGSSVGTRYFAC